MLIYLSSHIHQGDESFDIQSRGKQCAFNCLLGLLTAHKKPLTQWSPTTLNSILFQGDKLYVKAINNSLVNLPSGIELLSVADLPKVISVSCFRHEIIFDICCQWELGHNSLLAVAKNINLPTEGQNTHLPTEGQNTHLPTEGQNTHLPTEGQNAHLPTGGQNTDLPFAASPSEATSTCQPNIEKSVSSEASINDVINIEEKICVIDYKQELQGLVLITNEEIPSYYYKIHIAFTNTFMKYEYAFLILKGYMMALIKQVECFYLFDPHARNCFGMPDPNGTAVVMQFAE